MYTATSLNKKTFTKQMIVDKALDKYNRELNIKNSKAKLIREFLAIQDEFQELTHNPPKDYNDEILNINFPHYIVRYVGYSSILEHTHNSTPSGRAYIFHKNQWVRVSKIDFEQKYYPKVIDAVTNKTIPHWEVGRQSNDGEIFVVHEEYMRKISDNVVTEIKDFYAISEFHLVKLGEAQIKTIQDFMGIPDNWYIQSLGLDNVTLAHWKDQARKGIEAKRNSLREVIGE